ncbi:flagellar hook protein FlgE [Allosphingosinicella vermicomposti]|uniref:flagellar hook protein FlgE n=1 Tax=Allosphingosinicella vermicomposti TaxID=614671 RepID=UPI000D0F7AFD|nr:flagellar hook protein FlgE [Allosphingosinicella vermicomposti]
MSFYTSLSGLKGAQTDLATTSNNVANVNSYGFKKSLTLFGDIASASRTTPGNGTRLKAIEQQFMQGGFEATARELDIAITGNGFLVTRNSLTGGPTLFTRNGHLSLDKNNYLMDAAGGYVQVMPVDPEGNVTSTGLEAITALQIPAQSGVPQATSNIDLTINLPSSADLPSDRPVYNAANPYAFDRLDPNSYNHTVQTTVFDSAGRSIPATIYFVRTASIDGGDPTNGWEARMFVGSEPVTADAAAASQPAPLVMTFDAAGVMTAPAGAFTFADVIPAGSAEPLSLTLDFGSTAQGAGAFRLANIDQDGAAAGKLDDISIGADGLVTASYSNGDTRALGKLAIANFANPVGLKQRGDAHWSVTGDSGDAQIGEAGTEGFGGVQSGGLERANVDITDELVALISAQRNFQANAKAIETSNNMTQAIVNMRT